MNSRSFYLLAFASVLSVAGISLLLYRSYFPPTPSPLIDGVPKTYLLQTANRVSWNVLGQWDGIPSDGELKPITAHLLNTLPGWKEGQSMEFQLIHRGFRTLPPEFFADLQDGLMLPTPERYQVFAKRWVVTAFNRGSDRQAFSVYSERFPNDREMRLVGDGLQPDDVVRAVAGGIENNISYLRNAYATDPKLQRPTERVTE